MIIGGIYFMCNGIFTTLLLLQLAARWPNFMREWSAFERTMKHYPPLKKLRFRIVCIMVVYATIAISKIYLKI